MKIWVFPAGLAALLGFSATAAINTASQDVLRMVQNGVSESVIANYVNNSSASFNLNADDIVYMQQSGVPQSIIADMQTHDSGVAQQQQPQVYQNDQPAAADQNYQGNQNYQGDQSYVNQGSYSQYPADQTTAQVNPPDAYYDQQQPVVQVAAQQAPPQVASFYEPLRPYGNWIYLEGYGWCWQPYEVRTASNWQPYCDNGQWVYSEDGWYWQSYYNWGWAPFHYGRWMQANCGWVWFPDTVWAPSWVCWRNSADYCGWAPIPPSGFSGYGRPGFHFGVDFNVGAIGAGLFTFIHLGDIFHGGHDHGYRHYEIPRTQVTQIYNRTRVINNVTVVNNYYARNPGISRQTVERVAGPVHVAPVRTTTQDPRVARPGVVQNGSQVAIVRPQRPPTPEKTTTPIVAHRVTRDARTVPATPPTQVRSTRNTRQPQTTSAAPNQTTAPRSTSTSGNLRTPRSSDYQHSTTTQRPTDTSHNRGVTEAPQPSRTTEVPRPTTRTPVPTGTTPHTADLPHTSPSVTQTPRSTTTHRTDVPNPTPSVSEVPHSTGTPHTARTPNTPAPSHVTQTPRPAPAPTPAATVKTQPEVHRAYPQPTPRVETPHPAVHESAGAANPAPHAQPAPHVATPPAPPHVSTPPEHMSAPPAHVSAPPAHVTAPPPHPVPAPHAEPPQSARPATPPGLERRNDDGHGHQ